jgi:WhiB family redox-sensing transcriptional regulator
MSIQDVELPILRHPDSDSSWRDVALCRRSDVDFFGSNWHVAVKVCNVCMVKQQCLDFALKNDIGSGIWGGLTPKARKDLL